MKGKASCLKERCPASRLEGGLESTKASVALAPGAFFEAASRRLRTRSLEGELKERKSCAKAQLTD
jgi:hypothetical protein